MTNQSIDDFLGRMNFYRKKADERKYMKVKEVMFEKNRDNTFSP
eukprot:CAMPEP_0170544768 /NCGR_PEP_ID=MMETSP0211-20121228/3404_1 /TAXON_ID=311385 /ORGANISM="Pseudokeronopsis sp., Strain OXSARD2" /LENGTH=43 /DNA_ID= /DNA_START= /DNA_END= /DNA_ORIENTATION=